MVFTKALVLKVLGGLAVCTGVTVGGVKLFEGSGNNDQKDSNPTNQNGTPNAQNLQQQPQPQQVSTGANSGVVNSPKLDAGRANVEPKIAINVSNSELLLKELGLECSEDSTNADNGECTGVISGKTINVKWEDGTKREGITSLTIPSGAKIKYKKKTVEVDENNKNTYNKLLKVTIEGGDIELEGGTDESQITKLEEFETYEVKEGEGSDKGKYYLSRKTTIFDHKIKLLNIPKTCQLVTSETEASCSLTADELKKINFDGRSSDPSVVGGTTASLTILKTDEEEFDTEGYKFILRTNHNITISGGTGTKSYTIAPNTNTEFKIKGEESESTLERAWDIDQLAKKVNLENCGKSDTPGTMVECTFKANARVNVMNDNENIKDAEIISENPKMKYEKDKQRFNQGFKFYSQADIKLSEEKKIGGTGFGGSPYEIKKIGDKWYLSKVTESK